MMLSNVPKQTIRFCLVLNCIFIVKSMSEHRGYGAAVGTTNKGCPIGFIATNCSIPCRFPSFGLNCQEKCNCTENICNFKEGCRKDLTTYKMVTNTIYTIKYTRDILVHTWTNVRNIENTSPSREDIMTKSIDTNKRFSLHTVIVVLSILAFILVCVYVSTFAMPPRSQGIRNNVVLEIPRNSEQV